MFHLIFSSLDNFVSAAQTLLYVDAAQPLLFHFRSDGLRRRHVRQPLLADRASSKCWPRYARSCAPLEALRPVEQWENRKAVRVDVIYTWIAKLGILNPFFFLRCSRFFDNVQAWLRLHNISNIEFDNLWPGVTTQPLVAFVMYLLALDFAGYWYHRWQHRIGVWWELHAVHYSQQQCRCGPTTATICSTTCCRRGSSRSSRS